MSRKGVHLQPLMDARQRAESGVVEDGDALPFSNSKYNKGVKLANDGSGNRTTESGGKFLTAEGKKKLGEALQLFALAEKETIDNTLAIKRISPIAGSRFLNRFRYYVPVVTAAIAGGIATAGVVQIAAVNRLVASLGSVMPDVIGNAVATLNETLAIPGYFAASAAAGTAIGLGMVAKKLYTNRHDHKTVARGTEMYNKKEESRAAKRATSQSASAAASSDTPSADNVAAAISPKATREDIMKLSAAEVKEMLLLRNLMLVINEKTQEAGGLKLAPPEVFNVAVSALTKGSFFWQAIEESQSPLDNVSASVGTSDTIITLHKSVMDNVRKGVTMEDLVREAEARTKADAEVCFLDKTTREKDTPLRADSLPERVKEVARRVTNAIGGHPDNVSSLKFKTPPAAIQPKSATQASPSNRGSQQV